ncbi:fumarylacetoacetate hydrolase family protein [Mycobacterium sp. URHB0044]|uniref:fumarylacetoacetate hydrolase family protein n=1 Tax=Mycobacterium sp. URHB0044 TaxID=1380386 RepID=UPI00048A828D|nr:fumarylacetoacetate hydrolase family protein [Mycobacterium sp. URHB0044]
MRVANLDGRLVLLRDKGAVDVERASGGEFGSDPQEIYGRWTEFAAWAAGADLRESEPYDEALLGPPTPEPGQVYAIGLNYASHAAESGVSAPAEPAVFTKFRASITGPYARVQLPTDTVDWEAELVVVIGHLAHRVSAAEAWDHVAGLTVGQDLSERTLQLTGPAPQFSLGKSFPGFTPLGPCLVTPDELTDRDDLEVGCALDGEQMQKGRTGDLIFSVPALIERLSAVVPLSPGDLIFTGTPSGVGVARDPRRFISPGQELITWVEGIGQIRNTFVAGPRHITHVS